MSDLLSIGRSGVLAYQGALQTIGENVTNADTTGYSRRSVVLKEQSTYSGAFSLNRSASAFGGVQAAGVQRVWDQYKAANAWATNSDSSNASTRLQYLSTMETMLGDTNNGVGTRLTAVFTAATQLSANPADPSLRQAFLGAINDVTTAFRTTASNLSSLSNTIGTQARVQVDQTNNALDALAKVNLSLKLAAVNSPARAQLEDQRDSILDTLSGSMAIDTSFEADGSVTVRMNNSTGPLLVSSKSTIPSQVQLQSASDGQLQISVRGEDNLVQTAIPTGGTLAGLVGAATTAADRTRQLNGMASDFVTMLHDFQTNGVTDAGIPGRDLVTGTDAASIAMAVTDPAITVADIAAATPGDPIPADPNAPAPDPNAPAPDPNAPVTPTPVQIGVANGNLLSLVANSRGSDGLEQRWKSMVTDQALQVSSAKLQDSAASTSKDTAYSALDATTGVSLDNEAAELLRFQQAYSASAKVIQTARETMQSILDLF